MYGIMYVCSIHTKHIHICMVSNVSTFYTVHVHTVQIKMLYLVVDCNWGTGDIGEPCSTVELTGLGYISCVGLCRKQGSGSTLHMFIQYCAFDASDAHQIWWS